MRDSWRRALVTLCAEVYHRHLDDLTPREHAGLLEIMAARWLDAEDREKAMEDAGL